MGRKVDLVADPVTNRDLPATPDPLAGTVERGAPVLQFAAGLAVQSGKRPRRIALDDVGRTTLQPFIELLSGISGAGSERNEGKYDPNGNTHALPPPLRQNRLGLAGDPV